MRRIVLTICTAIMSLLACGIALQAVAGFDTSRFPPPGRLIDIGGYRLHLYCQGTGSPTVVLDAGMGDNVLHWTRVMRIVGQSTRVCAYDRAGLGWSDPARGPRTSPHIAAELAILLERAHITDPLVVVGHSFGAFNARLFAAAHPERVAGMVLVDAADPIWWVSPAGRQRARDESATRTRQGWIARVGGVRLYGLLLEHGLLRPPAAISDWLSALPDDLRRTQLALWSRPSFYRATAGQWEEMPVSAAAVNRAPLPADVPLAVITAGNNDTEEQRGLTRLSARGFQVVARGSGHDVHIERPALVSTIILRILAEARAGRAQQR